MQNVFSFLLITNDAGQTLIAPQFAAFVNILAFSEYYKQICVYCFVAKFKLFSISDVQRHKPVTWQLCKFAGYVYGDF